MKAGAVVLAFMVLQYANEQQWSSARAAKWRPVIETMLDRILASAMRSISALASSDIALP